MMIISIKNINFGETLESFLNKGELDLITELFQLNQIQQLMIFAMII